MMGTEIAASVVSTYANKRRSERYKIDVPVRIIFHKPDTTFLRDGRGTEFSEDGMCVMAGVELGVGEKVEIEFTLPYSGEPIRVPSAVRNRNGYRYGCEFIPDAFGERPEVARMRQVLQTFAAR